METIDWWELLRREKRGGQHLCGASLAHGQVRGHLPEGICDRAGLDHRVAELLKLQQYPERPHSRLGYRMPLEAQFGCQEMLW